MDSSPRDAVRVKVKKCEIRHRPEYRKFSVDPQITTIEVLQSLLIKAFDIKGEFTVSYRAVDEYGAEAYYFIVSDWDLDAAFFDASEPYLYLQVNLKPFGETSECESDWEQNIQHVATRPELGFAYKTPRLPGIIMNKMEKTLNLVQRAFGNLSEELNQASIQPPREPLTDAEFRKFLDPIGQIIQSKELRAVIYFGGIEPSLRKVVWKHILNVYPDGMSGLERMDYMKRKAQEYINLRDAWKNLMQNGQNIGDLGYVTSMVRKDVLRTDRHHKFYGGSDDNQNTASLFNILTTYALNHPSVSYCQGMSDLASPLLVTMRDEAQAYICLCALMKRLQENFMLNGIAMTTKFAHLSEGLQYYDPEFYAYLKLHQADDLLFCYRWLLLEMKREFALDEAMRMLEVLWASLPAVPPPNGELSLVEVKFPPSSPPPSPNIKQIRENAYTKVCALRRQSSSASVNSIKKRNINTDDPLTENDTGELERSISHQQSKPESECLDVIKNRKNTPPEKCFSLDSIPSLNPKKLMTTLLDFDQKLGSSGGLDQQVKTQASKCARVVRNLNEFLNFTSLNKSRVIPSNDSEVPIKMSTDDSALHNNHDESNSPDDLTDFLPMTTSITRELRLELESLDRQVFGPSPPVKDQQCDCNISKQEHEIIESEAETELPKCSPATDVFVWENPLHTLQNKQNPATPDEQVELEYDGEIIEDQNGVKSVTPIRLFKQTARYDDVSDSDGTDSWPQNSAATDSVTPPVVQEQCEEVTELTNLIPVGISDDEQQLGTDSLPPPSEFGGGNPFLMFLCITLLLQHRDYVIRNQMDYNEMAMHFDKMVRRHNVTKVLNQARRLFASYLKRHANKSEYVNS
ncbi:PREDICTED: TBC1 domain family member 25 [Ceratosolen solmsi marchali]|uniref:TBC1 domain family member 25 n=1 Tax=Ceratosolen solmsi marchali TaxID=326594 RepID=A0AAJ6YV94_9HYME|nr:PREDICTED: TBC1 domain family member 25 [Ceratosolen solmsi marchali]